MPIYVSGNNEGVDPSVGGALCILTWLLLGRKAVPDILSSSDRASGRAGAN